MNTTILLHNQNIHVSVFFRIREGTREGNPNPRAAASTHKKILTPENVAAAAAFPSPFPLFPLFPLAHLLTVLPS